ncbi:MAG: 2-(1,2-epoxy-1,2-dihydrophenyl)acetyl-CoA isomerase PaaG [Cytophagales bacterium]|nr:2-(1,2-epoxy-1,2-dihydrophenyl)acetyl-CoA isomerase PaaG [Cytophagales bacterium]
MSDVLFEVKDAVALVTLNRPAALNSFTKQMHLDLWAAFDQIEANQNIRAMVLTGAGRGFCAGADLSEFDFAAGADLVERANPRAVIHDYFNPTAQRLQLLRVPTIAAVNGVAAGAGASYALGCDITLAAPSASFIQAFSKIGLIPDSGGSWLLPQRLGIARAMALCMTGDKLTAAQAKEWGLIWDVADDALQAALAMASRMAAMPTKALVETRHLLRSAVTNTYKEQLDLERDVQSKLGYTHDYIEGVSAFLQKRPAQFKGE